MSAARIDRAALLTGRRAQGPVSGANPLVPAKDDPFTPDVIDPATVTGTPSQQLAVFEAAIDRAKETADGTLKAARARFVVEAGTALREIRDRNGGLYKGTHDRFEDYVRARWGMDRTRAYQLIDAAPAMLPVSKIFDTAPVESWARAVAPALEKHGESAVREIAAAVKTSGEKITARVITETGRRLGYIPPPAPAEDPGPPAELPTGHTPEQALALVRLEQGLAALRVAHKALRARVIPDAVAADPVRGSELVAQVADLAGKIERLTR